MSIVILDVLPVAIESRGSTAAESAVRPDLSSLDNRSFDVVIFGGGINGASSAHQLAAAGYNTLLVEKSDFGSGASSRSSRLLHCGLMYLAPYDSLSQMLMHPGHVTEGIQMARCAMRGRHNFSKHLADRLDAFSFIFPLSTDQPYSPNQVKIGFKILQALYSKGPPLNYDYLDRSAAQEIPFLKLLKHPERLVGAIRLEEYKYNWPERIVMDYILTAQASGATVRNYTAVETFERAQGGAWKVGLRDMTAGTNVGATVSTQLILNLTGVWSDEVNHLANDDSTRKVGMTKGVHIAVRLAPEFHGRGFVAMQKEGKGPYFCVPWYDTHYIGPTRTKFDGDIDDIRPTEQDIETLLEDTANLLPGLKLKRSQVLYAWAGVRPQTYDPTHPLGATHARKLHDLGQESMPNVFALTSSPIMYERQTGEDMLALVKKKVQPSRADSPCPGRFRPRVNERDILLDLDDHASDLREIAAQEHCVTLIDILCRRLGACWSEGQGLDIAPKVAEIVAETMDWDAADTRRELNEYRDYMQRFFLGPFAEV